MKTKPNWIVYPLYDVRLLTALPLQLHSKEGEKKMNESSIL
jgi:hypothetical protein